MFFYLYAEETPAEGTDKKEEVTQAKEETSATKGQKLLHVEQGNERNLVVI